MAEQTTNLQASSGGNGGDDSNQPASKEVFNSMTLDKLQTYLANKGDDISKNQRKKLMRRIEWLKHKPERKAQQKEKRKRKKEATKETADVKRPKITKMEESSCKIRVAIDLSLDKLMTEKVGFLRHREQAAEVCIVVLFVSQERGKSLKQLQRCYSLNRRACNPVRLYLTGIAGSFKQSAALINGFNNWDVHFSEGDHLSCFGKENVVYLSSESENELQELEEGKAYVIGGLVDHNRCKGLCHRLAEEQGVQHARLPIDSYLVLKTRKVLTIDQVFQILLKVTEGLSWKDAFLETIPQRKGAVALDDKSEDSNETPQLS
ncbi:tRNA methyltransferase 10 homolog A isoform X1 [Ixodes scapularis]|uniref:tRNA methyltransferase 10 homolog A isoform X1 n=1 Tax=Ixodes scapularis TaxID=6945 RepID=UPI001AD74003|nr:tRNA methyltransferase 10 homolog A isoform X1 [Ixodes scapularis]